MKNKFKVLGLVILLLVEGVIGAGLNPSPQSGTLKIQSLPTSISIEIPELNINAMKSEPVWILDHLPAGNYKANFKSEKYNISISGNISIHEYDTTDLIVDLIGYSIIDLGINPIENYRGAGWRLTEEIKSIKEYVNVINSHPESDASILALCEVHKRLDPLVPLDTPTDWGFKIKWEFSEENQYAYFIQYAGTGYTFNIGQIDLDNCEMKLFTLGNDFRIIEGGSYKDCILVETSIQHAMWGDPIIYSIYDQDGNLLIKYESSYNLETEIIRVEDM